jgi:hypothetical protein
MCLEVRLGIRSAHQWKGNRPIRRWFWLEGKVKQNLVILKCKQERRVKRTGEQSKTRLVPSHWAEDTEKTASDRTRWTGWVSQERIFERFGAFLEKLVDEPTKFANIRDQPKFFRLLSIKLLFITIT